MTATLPTPTIDFPDRLDLTALDLLHRARRLIGFYGHDGDGFGKPSTGFSLEGAIYHAAGFLEGPTALRDPESPAEVDLFLRCNGAFGAIARVLGADEVPAARAYIAVIEANAGLDQANAVLLLDQAVRAAETLSVGVGHYGRDNSRA